VRSFNEAAVPGIGGIWYGKQLLLATLGVAVAARANEQKIQVTKTEVANAIEALACILAGTKGELPRDPRLRGRDKLRGVSVPTFSEARKRSFYVTQPMRMANTIALPALGLVTTDGTRFNTFECSDSGFALIEAAFQDCRPFGGKVLDQLAKWVSGALESANTPKFARALSPLVVLPHKARQLLRERLLQGGPGEPETSKQRRRNALTLVGQARLKPVDANTPPACLTSDHWHDLKAGAKLFSARDSALSALDAMESQLIEMKSRRWTQGISLDQLVSTALEGLRTAANDFLDTKHSNPDARKFCTECSVDNDATMLRNLAERDGRVLALGEDGAIVPGQAFNRARLNTLGMDDVDLEDDDASSPVAIQAPLPVGFSYRMRNLYLLSLDLDGKLDESLSRSAAGGRA